MTPLHGIGSRQDLPLPFSFVLVGAALALVISFVVLLAAWRRPRYAGVTGRALPRATAVITGRPVAVVARGLILAVYGWAALALVAGQDVLTNPVFGFVYVGMWVALVPLSLLLGPFWRATNPIRTLHRGLCALARVDPGDGVAPLPAWVGVWPAALGVVAFGWLELVEPDNTALDVLRLWAVLWVVVLIVGAVVFGDRWIGAADPFETYATAVAQLSPWQWRSGQLRLVSPLAGLTTWSPPPGSSSVVAALLGVTAYDSLSATTWWVRRVQDSSLPVQLWGTAGLIATVLAVWVSFAVAASALHRFRRDPEASIADFPRRLAASLVPIIIGYTIAHYATLLIIEGQRTVINWSDPLGRGWNVFGSADGGVNAGIVDYPAAVALLQVIAIVGGHLVGIVAAHEQSVTLVQPAAALRAQVPMLVVMIGYTCAGLLLLFSP